MLKSLQMARGIAALAVTLFHTSGMFADPRYGFERPFWWLTERGDLGVDFFFVLSGFIIMLAHRADVGRPREVGNYAFKRAVRIYPMYWLFTLLIVVGAVATSGVTALPTRIEDAASIAALVHFTGVSTPLGTAWTLFHEIVFYAFFALLIVDRRLGIAALALWLGAIAINFRYTPFGEWSFVGTLLSAHNISFFLGIGAFFLSRRLSAEQGWAFLLGGITMLAIVFLNEHLLGRSDILQLCFAIAFALMITGVVAVERTARIRESALLLAIGNASYTLYLCHENVGATLLKIAAHTGLTGMIDHRLLYGGFVIGIVVFSLIAYRYVEAPLLRWLRERYLAGKAAWRRTRTA